MVRSDLCWSGVVSATSTLPTFSDYVIQVPASTITRRLSMNQILLKSDIEAFLKERGVGTRFEHATKLSIPDTDSRTFVMPSSWVRIPSLPQTARRLQLGPGQNCVVPPLQMLTATLTANQMWVDKVHEALDEKEQEFLDLMNGDDRGQLHLFYFTNWSCRPWAGRFDFNRVVTAVKELS
jgi:hypothetical protein